MGHDVAHDWEWWRKQMPYFLGQSVSIKGVAYELPIVISPTIRKIFNSLPLS